MSRPISLRPKSTSWSLVAVLLAATAAAPAIADTGKLRLTGGVSTIEGAAGGGISPWAVIGGPGAEGQLGLAAHVSRAETQDYGLTAYGVTAGINDRLEARVRCPEIPGLQPTLSCSTVRLGEKVLKSKPNIIGTDGLKILATQAGKSAKLFGREIFRIRQPKVSCFLQFDLRRRLISPHLVNSVIDDFRQVKPVKCDFRFGKRLPNSLDEGRRHIAGNLRNLRWTATPRIQILCKTSYGICVLPRRRGEPLN